MSLSLTSPEGFVAKSICCLCITCRLSARMDANLKEEQVHETSYFYFRNNVLILK